jgi:hypothetical protein
MLLTDQKSGKQVKTEGPISAFHKDQSLLYNQIEGILLGHLGEQTSTCLVTKGYNFSIWKVLWSRVPKADVLLDLVFVISCPDCPQVCSKITSLTCGLWLPGTA